MAVNLNENKKVKKCGNKFLQFIYYLSIKLCKLIINIKSLIIFCIISLIE